MVLAEDMPTDTTYTKLKVVDLERAQLNRDLQKLELRQARIQAAANTSKALISLATAAYDAPTQIAKSRTGREKAIHEEELLMRTKEGNIARQVAANHLATSEAELRMRMISQTGQSELERVNAENWNRVYAAQDEMRRREEGPQRPGWTETARGVGGALGGALGGVVRGVAGATTIAANVNQLVNPLGVAQQAGVAQAVREMAYTAEYGSNINPSYLGGAALTALGAVTVSYLKGLVRR